ncbi:hypothetical protein AF335_11015 [Streptomyces eurocidicus]|uniref:Uncharacterized protein n=1 Tax=Streptomyces eurocidicus TaxID=66423 RepID=A0A2N8NXD5_STREU|nr:hypothetical protein [Streptomyces eurocidicus]MBB5120451.1 hypothetical protein [Streptomyces eurocidicus]MBF6053664.1 hypothetical protein [Streptomyces eurocidicus]PNE33419.1 hypothetical protein AF335_11015 [Streptomyces eurocidicus]
MTTRADFAAAADEFANRVLGALRGAGGTALVARHIDSAPDALAALAAVRVLGADTFSPHLLAGAPFHADDAAAVARSFDAFPTPVAGPSARPEERTVAAWRDWATTQLLGRFGGMDSPPAPPGPADDLTDTTDWQSWSVRMAQLATLATPGLDGPVHELARGAAFPLARGVTRSVLRRDFPTAVRLVRWLAWLAHEGVALPLDPAPVHEHVRLLGGASPRTALDLAVTDHLLTARTPEAVRT